MRVKRAATESTLQPHEAQGMSKEEILGYFYTPTVFTRAKKEWKAPFDPSRFRGLKLLHDLIDAKTGKARAEAGEKLTPRLARKLAEEGAQEVQVNKEDLVGHYLAVDVINEKTGEIFAEAGDELTEALLGQVEEAEIAELPLLSLEQAMDGTPIIRNTLLIDKNADPRGRGSVDIYRVMRPGEPPTLETAEALFQGLFFDSERYDLSAVGRVKMNARLGIQAEDTVRTLRKEDILSILKVLIELKDGRGEIDDIDQSRQSARALGRRTDGEPVSGRPPARRRARHPRAHELGRDRHRDAA